VGRSGERPRLPIGRRPLPFQRGVGAIEAASQASSPHPCYEFAPVCKIQREIQFLPVCHCGPSLIHQHAMALEFGDITEMDLDEVDAVSQPLTSVSKERARELQMKREATRRKKAEQMGKCLKLLNCPHSTAASNARFPLQPSVAPTRITSTRIRRAPPVRSRRSRRRALARASGARPLLKLPRANLLALHRQVRSRAPRL
jgi:hypothetical protein